jgi:hypothetical protein
MTGNFLPVPIRFHRRRRWEDRTKPPFGQHQCPFVICTDGGIEQAPITQTHLCRYMAKQLGPGVEMVLPKFLRCWEHQVARRGPALGDGVGDRRAGGEHNAAATFQQPLGLQEHVSSTLALCRIGQALDSLQPGGERKVVGLVRFIHFTARRGTR